jgi:uncharacterized protein YprB with RNaseH-like and TPR domain
MGDLADLLASEEEAAASTPLRVLFFDIETAPMLAYIWQARTEYVGTHQIEHETFLLTWAAKWSDRKKVHGDKLNQGEAEVQDDSRIVASLADLIRQADVICGHNVDRFDLPMLNNRLLLLGLDPLGPVRTVDTLKMAKRSFRLASNKLDWLAQQLGLGGKIGTDFDLWRRCYQGDEKALAAMLRYNRRDVALLQQVYERMEPYVRGAVPRLVDGDGTNGLACPTCGSGDVSEDGFHRTNSSSYPRFVCGSCGRRSRSRNADRSKRLRLTPM